LGILVFAGSIVELIGICTTGHVWR
jgi:hypothetical protein